MNAYRVLIKPKGKGPLGMLDVKKVKDKAIPVTGYGGP
jgi:hypothetical protein